MRAFPPILRMLLTVTVTVLSLPHANAQHYTFKQYGQAEGLHNLNVTSLLQDRDGFLWAGTENGLYRYDGASFTRLQTVEGIDDHDISAIHQDELGRIWISTLHDLFYADHGPFRRISSQQKLQMGLRATLTSFPDDPNRIFLVNNSKLAVAKSSDLGTTWTIDSYFSPQQLKSNPDLQNVTGLLATQEQHLWFGCGQHLCESTFGHLQVFDPSKGLPEDRWKPVLIDHSGVLWVRGLHHIASCTSSGCTLRDSNLGQALTGTKDATLAEDAAGHILANLPLGIARLENGKWTIFTSKNGIPPFPVGHILVDHQGSPWFALAGHGLARWTGYDTWEAYTTAEGLTDDQIWGIHQDSLGVWVGTQTDLQWKPNGSTVFTARPDVHRQPLPAVQTLARSKDGHLWGGENDGDLIEYDPIQHRSRIVTNLQSIISLVVDSSNRLWICSQIGLYTLDLNSGQRNHPTQVMEIPSVRVYKAVRDRKGGLWFMSNAGLFHMTDNRWAHIQLPADFTPQFAEHVALQADDSFWLNGVEPLSLLHARMNGEKLQVLDRIPSTSLSSSEIVELDIDSRGWLWVGTDAGVDVFNGKEWQRVTEESGLIWNDIDGASFFPAPDGTVWIGTSAGLAHLVHPENLFHTRPLSAWITEAKRGTQVFASLDQSQLTELPWARLPVSFHLAASDFANSSVIAFRYRLADVEDWSETTSHELRYPPLRPGYYRLEVVAENTVSHAVSPVEILSFTILAPWWQTKLFYAGVVVLILILAWLIWRWNVRLLIIRQRYLERLVSERTEELRLIATRDSLTGLLNRAAIFEQLEREIHRCQREGSTLAVALADLDHFKEINDTYGHLVGDAFLQEYGNRILSAVRSYDYVGRYGGEELLIILPSLDPDIALKRLEELRLAVCGTPFRTGEINVPVTCSFGLAWFDCAVHDCTSLVDQADQALYRAKMNGRNRVEYYPAYPSSY